jgi:hypothetical protein
LASFVGAVRGFTGEQSQRVAARQSAEDFADSSRRFQFGLDTLHGADGDAKVGSDLAQPPIALRECRTDTGFRGRVDLWSA